ncbi:MAG TPA: argininosuccinate lyase [Hungateiclostridium thermocellum]|jgi:argininosuccinate lyase|uniref:Argininosuccinate lyase n=2 Tax=Acetivibrio thermocellus TaxID=1515 RepID=ARLY_ACET2|nr:argininosuccinate lyase [Acetivibrio thermocellus]A3DBU0.1 RecName: Full=Argininosuccinate lyase; Short=ASAL; AltName: Full=Arginosuccinase [Acetivibrio thermocellus ATCC 27405]CDG34857.1 Argininosuccinate lyase [Acetivibrio thermocellus BC1]ABN51419.1 argininosuccinate lyase [Acetivibrio thermocellus ATCC 27405]ADU75096.1 argininosuccinate lyase [Acetivibrio thermocellus DSM 1313]ALX09073.1 Argininosuccinate lyase [Acetivibrio thermocellus AD2]ANV76824.1 Argininosuccinate lyase [Acetivibr
MKLWGGRFEKNTDKSVDDFNSSIRFDCRMYKQDILGSIAHAKMLGKCKIISEEDSILIQNTLREILKDIEEGKVQFEIDAEDIHMNVEKILISRIGDVGKKLHTGRSRNDQVALDIRMYLRDEVVEIRKLLVNLERTLIEIAKNNIDTILPGYTHLQRAQPITFAHHMMAYFQMFKRDIERLNDCYKRINVMPLGSGALASTTYPLDRYMVAKELGFDSITENSLDAVSDRDFVIELSACLSILMMHLSRFSEEIILWASHEFGFIELDDAYSTGSSIMPQKKNPDVAELVRGKTGRVYGDLMALLSVMKSLPLAYNKDMQEDKEAIFDAVDTVKMCLPVFTKMIETMKIKKENMLRAAQGGFTNATDMADYLVKKGIPFRNAHEIIGKMVLYCIENNKAIEELDMSEFKSFSELIEEDVYEEISLSKCVSGRNLPGGPAKESVMASIENGLKFLSTQ